MGRTNLSGKKIDKESYTYYIKNYNAQKSYYKKKGYTDLIPLKMSKSEWEFRKANEPGITNREIIYEEFHKYSKAQTEQLYSIFKQEGVKLSRGQISRGQFSAAAWTTIKNTYRNLRSEGMTSTEAAIIISQTFWGSM